MKKYSLKERFRYWFDNQMAKGSGSMIIMLAAATAFITIIFTFVIFLVCRNDEISIFASFWDSLATIINAWMPYSSDGSTGYLILTAVVALVGLLFTSVLIGIVSSYIEDKISMLRKGTSAVLEQDHIVVLGFAQGEYTLITQLVEAAGNHARRIVIAGAMEKDEMESDLRDNIQVPKNVRIICRNLDICDPVALECCAIPNSSVVIVNASDDARTVRAILAVRKLLNTSGTDRRIPIIGAVSDRKYTLPEFTMEAGNIILLYTEDLISRVIAHSVTQIGLSNAFTEVFNFEGSEFYTGKFPALAGRTFLEISDCCHGSVPIGIIRENESILVPQPGEVFRKDDRLLYFSEARENSNFENSETVTESDLILSDEPDGKVVILGSNDILSMVRSELPEDISEITVIEDTDTVDLETRIEGAKHIILLSNSSVEEEEADMQSILTLLTLRDIRARKGADFNITVEMKNEKERNLVMTGDTTDFIVASDFTAMVLAQLAENPDLYQVFGELLSNTGCEFYIKKIVSSDDTIRTMTVGNIRHNLLTMKHIMLGYVVENDGAANIRLNPGESEELKLDGSVKLIVIGE